jgi:hypothetical protein
MESRIRGLCMLTAWALGRQSQPWQSLHYPKELTPFHPNRLGNGLVDVLICLACRTAISQFIGAAQGALTLKLAKVAPSALVAFGLTWLDSRDHAVLGVRYQAFVIFRGGEKAIGP